MGFLGWGLSDLGGRGVGWLGREGWLSLVCFLGINCSVISEWVHVITFKAEIYCRFFECRRSGEGCVEVGYAEVFKKSFDLLLI